MVKQAEAQERLRLQRIWQQGQLKDEDSINHSYESMTELDEELFLMREFMTGKRLDEDLTDAERVAV